MGRPIPNYESYSISREGVVTNTKTGKILKPSILNNGYCKVELFNKHGSKALLVHRLVAIAYLPNPYKLPQINHKDENKQNNNVSNLEWCTAKYNMNYGTRTQRQIEHTNYDTEQRKIIAVANGKKCSKPVVQIDVNGNIISYYTSGGEAHKITGINHSHILECCNLKRKTAGGFIWKFGRGNDLSGSRY